MATTRKLIESILWQISSIQSASDEQLEDFNAELHEIDEKLDDIREAVEE